MSDSMTKLNSGILAEFDDNYSSKLEGSLPLKMTRGFLEAIAKKLLLSVLKKSSSGTIKVTDGTDTYFFGEESTNGPKAEINIVSPLAWSRTVFAGTIGSAESFIRGEWKSPDLVSVIRFFCANRDTMDQMEGGLAYLSWPSHKLFHLLRRDTEEGSKRNISAHYDLGNDFFSIWLDPSMTYSSGLFSSTSSTLLSASLKKIDSLCQKLQLKSTDHLLEIGSGWGSFAIYAASNFGCKVTTVTISKKQYEFVQSEITKYGLSDRVEVLFSDYRSISGQFDKVVSVEMIEAVGDKYLETYFKKISTLLKPEGICAIQAITIRDQFFDYAVRNVDFIQRYIFPGSNIPSTSRMLTCVKEHSDMILTEFEDLTAHYEKTIAFWRRSFWKNEDKIRQVGFSDQNLRLWDYYFAYCQGGFAERVIGVAHLVFSKPKQFKRRNEPVSPQSTSN
jgi:cyclopropane-fatty-acyl-phospholipid synthase